ncbi:hypothetical protein L6R50_23550 [Myxococcota bacterium]|nr:hypothetical protein [Myxococcota bacterium]
MTVKAARRPEPGPASALWDAVERVNDILRASGADVVQRVHKGRNAPVFYGYVPQAVIDAVCRVFGPEGWDYALLDEPRIEAIRDGHSLQATVRVGVDLRLGDAKVHREAFGTCVQRDPGDAMNGAVTYAIQKAMSRAGVGRDAYAGRLAAFAGEVDAREGRGFAPTTQDDESAGGRGASPGTDRPAPRYVPRVPLQARGQRPPVPMPEDWAARVGHALQAIASGDDDLLRAMSRVLTGWERDGDWRGWESLRAFHERAEAWKQEQAWFRFTAIDPDVLRREAERLLGREPTADEAAGAPAPGEDEIPFDYGDVAL